MLDGVTVQAGDRDLLVDVDWTAMPGHRVGLVGANGCGKSTLLRCLCGQRSVNNGRLMVGSNVEVGYLEQTAVSGSDRPVWAEVRSQMTRLVAAEAALDAAAQAAEKGDPGAPEMLQLAQDQFDAAGGYDADKRIANVLTGLGFKQGDWSKLCSDFSGGWQMRIALARLLLGPAGQSAASGDATGVLFLDEPTNHLDRAACKWLGTFLKTSSGGVVIVSHDEELLESACDRIVEVRGRKLHHYVGGYAKFLEQRAIREAQERATAEAQQAEIARLETFVTRFGAKASKATQAQSRAKQLEKLREAAIPLPAASSGAGPGDARKVALRLPKAPACDEVVLQLKGASIGWGSCDDGREPLLTGVDLVVKRGQRLLVLGPNGAGKSTLLKALSGAVDLWKGGRELGDRVKLVVFSQDLAQDLPLEKPALDYVMDTAREDDVTVVLERGRQALGALGLSGSMALRKISALSGGEKARVALAAFALVPSNLLLLDEASNHLDAATIAALTGALQDYNGALVAITHNPAFARSLEATHVLRAAAKGAARRRQRLPVLLWGAAAWLLLCRAR
ncbi:hypothetical protein WJX81_005746 [Elliptochloris bilobata]|uniref:ABC transporter domain-containing protein n=1 Tax=Elliptochloris bilobata TaxID=381761 RepID=A0AAW1QNT6_9CHLO